jgi:glycosyltransferase involved in cell wall biosynthesis
VKLVLVGDYKDDPFLSAYPALRSRVDELDLADSVIFTGFVPDSDLVELYNAATLVVMPSLDEGFGLPAVEAMACGTPVASSDKGSLPEVLGDAGAYFDPLDLQSITSVVGTLLEDSERRAQMRERGLARSRSFRWERSAAETLSIFNELCGVPNHG